MFKNARPRNVFDIVGGHIGSYQYHTSVSRPNFIELLTQKVWLSTKKGEYGYEPSYHVFEFGQVSYSAENYLAIFSVFLSNCIKLGSG